MPYWRLSAFYFFYFAALGAIVPYLGIYLRDVGMNARQIGDLMAILMLSRIIAPYFWAWVSDYHATRMRIVRIASLLAAIGFGGMLLGTGFFWLVGVMLAFSFFWNATLPPVEAATMAHTGVASRYARVRLWGSVGFIVAVIGLGALFDIARIWWLLPIILLLLLGIWVASLLIPERELGPEAHDTPNLGKVLMRPAVLAFLLAALLMQASHGPYYTFYTIYLSDHGYTKSLIGILWALGVICEIVLFVWLHRVQRRYSVRIILLASFALASARWLMIGHLADSLAMLVIAQVLHAASFGAFHASAVELVHRFFAGRHQTRGQAIYGAMSFGLGGALGSYYSGLMWQSAGAEAVYTIAAMLTAIAFVVIFIWVRQDV